MRAHLAFSIQEEKINQKEHLSELLPFALPLPLISSLFSFLFLNSLVTYPIKYEKTCNFWSLLRLNISINYCLLRFNGPVVNSIIVDSTLIPLL